jgi:hypothetical protein
MSPDFEFGLLSDVRRQRDEAWSRAVTAGPEAMAEQRAEYAANGWTLCEHDTCPPFDCRADVVLIAPVRCTNPTHDHDAITDPGGSSDPTSNLCNDCKEPMHYDRTQEWYFHNDPDPAKACFLSGPNAESDRTDRSES